MPALRITLDDGYIFTVRAENFAAALDKQYIKCELIPHDFPAEGMQKKMADEYSTPNLALEDTTELVYMGKDNKHALNPDVEMAEEAGEAEAEAGAGPNKDTAMGDLDESASKDTPVAQEGPLISGDPAAPKSPTVEEDPEAEDEVDSGSAPEKPTHSSTDAAQTTEKPAER